MKPLSKRHNLRLISEIGVTPLLNLVMVLLLVFVLAVPLLQQEPVSASSTTPPPSVIATLAMASDQSIRLNDVSISQENLLRELKTLVSTNPETGVVVKVDGHLPVQNLVEVMALLKSAGVRHTAVATAGPEPKK